MKSILNFMNTTKKIKETNKQKTTDKNVCNYVLFRTDVYFAEYPLVVEIDEKGHIGRDLIFEKKRQEALQKKLGCKFIRINMSKENYDADYEATRIQTLISKFKDS